MTCSRAMGRIAGQICATRAVLVVGAALVSVWYLLPLIMLDDRIIREREYFTYHLPVSQFARTEFLEGRLPLWLPHFGCGIPIHAGQQAALFYPFQTVPILLLGANAGLRASLFGHALAAFLGQYLLCRHFQVGRLASLAGGMIAAQSGFLVARICASHLVIALQFCLLPWLGLGFCQVLRDPSSRRAAALGAVLGLMLLAGNPQLFVYAGTTAMACVVCVMVGDRKKNMDRLLWLLVAALGGVLVGAIQLLPALELAREGISGTERSQPGFADQFSLRTIDLARFLIPDLGGNPERGIPSFQQVDWLFHEHACYVGILTLVLAVCSVATAPTRSWQLLALGLALFWVVFALGQESLVFRGVTAAISPLQWFRGPGRGLAISTILLSLLAADGLQAIQTRRPWDRVAIWAVGAFTWVTGMLIVDAHLQEHWSWRELKQFVASAVEHDLWPTSAASLLAATGALVLASRFVRRAQAKMLILAAFLAIDLGFHNGLNFRLEPPPDVRMPPELLARDQPIRYIDAPWYPEISTGYFRYGSLAGLAARKDVSTVCVSDGGVLPSALEQLHAAIAADPERVLRIASCNYAALDHGRRWNEIEHALPRIRLLEAPVPSSLAERSSEERPAESVEMKVIQEDPRELVLETSLANGAVLLIADTWYPGWKCWVNDEATPVARAYGVFRSISLPRGISTVRLAFEPASFRWGAILAFLGLAGLLVLVSWPRFW